jgi:hypothetical protein
VLGPSLTIAGVDLPLPYAALYRWVPGFSAMRYPYRFGVLIVFVEALLAAAGWAWVTRGRGRLWLAALATIAVCVEFRRAPLRVVPVEVAGAVPPVYRWLAEHGAGRALLEWPIVPQDDIRAGYQHARAMYFSTYHWLPLVNGYTAYEPPSLRLLLRLAERLPDRRSVRDLVDLSGVQLLLLHRDRLRPADRDAFTAWLAQDEDGCTPLVEFDADVVCAFPPAREDLRARLLDANRVPPARSLRGVVLDPLPEPARSARIAAVVHPATAPVGAVVRSVLEVTNQGNAVWPGLGPLVPGVVSVRWRWSAGPGAGAWKAVPLLCDLRPRETCRVDLIAQPPPRPGGYELEVALGQEGGGPFAVEGGAVRLPLAVLPKS